MLNRRINFREGFYGISKAFGLLIRWILENNDELRKNASLKDKEELVKKIEEIQAILQKIVSR